MNLRRTLLATRDGAAIAATAGRLAGLSATVDLLAAVPPLVAELPPAPSLGAGPPDLALLDRPAERVVSGDSSTRQSPRPLPASRLAAVATRYPAPADDRPPARPPAAVGVAASTEASSVPTGDDDSTRPLSPMQRVEDTLRNLDRSGRGVFDRRVSVPLVPAAVAEPGRRRTDDIAATVTHRPRLTGPGRAGADASGRLAAPATPVAAAVAVPGSAVVPATAVTDPDRTFTDLGGDDSYTASHPSAAHHTGGTVVDLHPAGSGEVARRLADLPELFAADRVAPPSATGQGDDPPAAAADRRPGMQPTPALEAVELEELLAELLAREAEAHGLDGRLT